MLVSRSIPGYNLAYAPLLLPVSISLFMFFSFGSQLPLDPNPVLCVSVCKNRLPYIPGLL